MDAMEAQNLSVLLTWLEITVTNLRLYLIIIGLIR